MTNLINRIAGVAMIALTAAPLSAVATLAHAQPAVVRFGDLDMATAQGKATFEQRAGRAAMTVCGDRGRISLRESVTCQVAVKSEAVEKLADWREAKAGKARDYAAK
jgi:UrcA family protein